jgi:FeS assembly protein IscX
MPQKLKWSDIEDIALILHEKMPEVDPLTVRFTDLHKWVQELEDFSDDPRASNEAKLEAIQSAWNEEYREAQEEGD